MSPYLVGSQGTLGTRALGCGVGGKAIQEAWNAFSLGTLPCAPGIQTQARQSRPGRGASSDRRFVGMGKHGELLEDWFNQRLMNEEDA